MRNFVHIWQNCDSLFMQSSVLLPWFSFFIFLRSFSATFVTIAAYWQQPTDLPRWGHDLVRADYRHELAIVFWTIFECAESKAKSSFCTLGAYRQQMWGILNFRLISKNSSDPLFRVSCVDTKPLPHCLKLVKVLLTESAWDTFICLEMMIKKIIYISEGFNYT